MGANIRKSANSSIEESGGSTRESRTKVGKGRGAVTVKCKRECATVGQLGAVSGAKVHTRGGWGMLMRVGGGSDAAAEARRDEGRIRFGGGARTDLYCYLCRVSQ